jgi:hypothetical protein
VRPSWPNNETRIYLDVSVLLSTLTCLSDGARGPPIPLLAKCQTIRSLTSKRPRVQTSPVNEVVAHHVGGTDGISTASISRCWCCSYHGACVGCACGVKSRLDPCPDQRPPALSSIATTPTQPPGGVQAADGEEQSDYLMVFDSSKVDGDYLQQMCEALATKDAVVRLSAWGDGAGTAWRW